MNSRGIKIFNRRACHRPSFLYPSDQTQGPPRATTEGKEEIGVWGPPKTHPELHFQSLSTTCPRGYLQRILPQFYPLCIFIFHVGMDCWSPPEGLDPMTLVFLSYEPCRRFIGGLRLLPRGAPLPIFCPLRLAQGGSPTILTSWWPLEHSNTLLSGGLSLEMVTQESKVQHGEVIGLQSINQVIKVEDNTAGVQVALWGSQGHIQGNR